MLHIINKKALFISLTVLIVFIFCGGCVRMRIRRAAIRQKKSESVSTPAPTPIPKTQKRFNVGLKIVDFEYQKEIVTTAVWYPTEEEPVSYTYHEINDNKSRLALDAPIAKFGPYPFILFVHGAYGSGYNAAFFMEYLASHGYIVAAPDYVDTKPPDYKQQVAFSRIKEGNVERPLRLLKTAKQFIEDMSND